MNGAEFQSVLDSLKAAPTTALTTFFAASKAIDAVEYFDVRVETELKSSDEARLVGSHLAHISVNPQDDFVTQFLIGSYVFDGAHDRENIDGIQILNSSIANIEAFVTELVQIAKSERDRSIHPTPLHSMKSLSADRCMVILGARGAGKTFLLNYVLSKWNEQLSQEKVIWVRLNLVTKSGFEDSLYGWIYAQIAKVLLRYYDTSSAYVSHKSYPRADFYAALFEWAENNKDFTHEERREIRSKIRRMKDSFSRFGGEARINPSLCDYEICSNLFRIARELEWSFIIVLDGFDNLDVDKFQYDRFELIKSQLNSLWSSYENSGFALLIASRTYTFAELTSSDPFKRITPEHKFVVTAVPIEKIVKMRVEAVKLLLNRTVSTGAKVFAERNWTELIDGFATELAKDTSIFNELNAAYHDNNRAKVQLVQLMFQEYLQRKTGQGYRLLEHAMKAGLTYPPAIYAYQQTNNDVMVSVDTETDYDARYIPILTRPPIPRDGQKQIQKKYFGSESMLHGVRLLQIVTAITKRFAEKADMDFPLIKEICEALFEFFGYDPGITSIYIREMEAFELVRVLRLDSQPADSTMFQCHAMPKAEYAIKYYLSDVAFLNLAAMRTYFSENAFKGDYIRIGRLNQDNPASVRNWIETKLSNSLTMFMLMTLINRVQKERVQRRLSQRTVSGRLKQLMEVAISAGMFDFVIASEEQIRSESRSIYRSLVSSRRLAEIQDLDEEIRIHKDRLIYSGPKQ